MRRCIVLAVFVLATFVAQAGPGFGYHNYRSGRPVRLTPFETNLLIYGVSGLLLAISLYAAYITYLYYTKGPRNKKKMESRAQLDPVWNHDAIIAHARQLYLDLQNAWTARNLAPVQSKLSASFFRHQQSILNRYRSRKTVNYLEEVRIEHSSVIYFEDYLDDRRDAVAILLKGTMKDYFGRENFPKAPAESAPFKDALVFIRHHDTWLLDEIMNDPDFHQVVSPKTYIEQ